jgi:hypothetical protein
MEQMEKFQHEAEKGGSRMSSQYLNYIMEVHFVSGGNQYISGENHQLVEETSISGENHQLVEKPRMQTMQWPNVKGQKNKQISPDILGFSTGW